MDTSDLDMFLRNALERAWGVEVPAPPDFDEAAYLARWPDIAEAIAKGDVKSPFVHYVLVGRQEGRPRPTK